MKEETVLSLKWQSFPSHLAVSLDTCYEKQQFVDLSLVCKDGTVLKCHKMVLANASSFFRRLLVANDHPHPMIILHDIEADDLKTIVNFMYCGEIQVIQSEVRRLLKLAEILEVTGLQHVQTSTLPSEVNNTVTARKSTAISRIKLDETKGLSTKTVPDNESNCRAQNKTNNQTRYVPSAHSYNKVGNKILTETRKKCDESNVSLLSQRLDTGNSGISIVDINNMPSTSRGISNVLNQKRKESSEALINWSTVLSTITKDKAIPLKKLCIMDEVEITVAKPTTNIEEIERNEPLDRRKETSLSKENNPLNYAVVIKDEVDIFEMEEDVDMDPLSVEDPEREQTENLSRASQLFSVKNLHQTYYNSSKKGSNGS